MKTVEQIEWISVKDDTPDDGIAVLVACGIEGSDYCDVFEGQLIDGQWKSPESMNVKDVLYWAEMPEGPKCNDKAE